MIGLRSDKHVKYSDYNDVNDFCALFAFLHPYISRISRGISDIADTLGIKGSFENLFSNKRPERCLCKILRKKFQVMHKIFQKYSTPLVR